MTTLDEKELRFTFPSGWLAEHFDAPGRATIDHFQPVDFVVELSDRILFIEVKDPSNTKAPQEEREGFIRKMKSKELTHKQLVPKARTSWAFLRLMKRAEKPITYIVVIGAEALRIDPPLWLNLTDRLKERLAKEIDVPWPLQYIDSCIVVPASELSIHLPGVSVQRIGANP
jgi:hypothetical protein